MIGYLRGAVVHRDTCIETLDVNGIGYEINTPVTDGFGALIELWIHEHAPQDAPHELYGFREREQRDLFRRLLNIKGVGPKVAMRIVASGELLAAADGNLVFGVQHLTKIRGVGATLAQRIVEEMR